MWDVKGAVALLCALCLHWWAQACTCSSALWAARAAPAALLCTDCSPGRRPPASTLSLRRVPRAVQASDDCRWFLLTASLTAMVGSGLLGALLASRPGRRGSVRLMYVLAASPLVLGIQVGAWLGCCVQGPCAVLAFIPANHRRRKAAGLGGCLWPPGPPPSAQLARGDVWQQHAPHGVLWHPIAWRTA